MDCKSFSWNTAFMINRALPEQNAILAGYAALIHKHELSVPLPFFLAAISEKHTKYETDNWRVFTPRHAPKNTLYGLKINHLKLLKKYSEKIEIEGSKKSRN